MSADEMVAKAFGLSSFTTVGHLLHINLKDGLLQHKHEIGQALLNKNTRALAVVNKLNSIDNTYRNFDIEIIAKRPECTLSDEELMICEVNENKCRYRLDFSKVYWNSRLCTEHGRILAKLNRLHDVVFDVFAGIGPFSVPAAKEKCKTFANDLNPDSVKWLEVNMVRNKVLPSTYRIFNKDAKEFILNDIRSNLIKVYTELVEEKPAISPRIHILMNLPALAPTFLPHFIGLLSPKPNDSSKIDGKTTLDIFREQNLEHIAYCYCFLKGVYDDPRKEVEKIIEENIMRKLTVTQLREIFKVRNVAPYKDMYRVEIKLDESILFDTSEPASILKKSSQNAAPLSNGHIKTVTIDLIEPDVSLVGEPTICESSNEKTEHKVGQKRFHEETLNSSDPSIDSGEISPKRTRDSSYCAII